MTWKRFDLSSRSVGVVIACAVIELCSISCTGTHGHETAESQVHQLADQMLYGSLALSPSSATAAGYHQHEGINLDEQLDDFSQESMDKQRAFYESTEQRAEALHAGEQNPELKADLEVILAACRSSLLDITRLQIYRHNPTIYVETLGNALYSPFILNYAPESKRLSEITARVEKIPAYVETAKRNLIDAPEVWNRVAREENAGNIELIDKTIRGKIPPDLTSRYDPAATSALDALRGFNTYLKDDLSKHTSEWRIGVRNYADKFRLTLQTDDTPQGALADAEARLQEIRANMAKQAASLWPKYFWNAAAPSDANTLISRVLNQIAHQHSSREQYFEDAKTYLAEARAFVQKKHLLTLPTSNNLEVIPTPEFQRGVYAVGGFSPAPALQPELGAYYWITPFTPDMTAQRVESKLREYNTYGLQILTLHEAMPGHYVQFEYAGHVQPAWRGRLRVVFSNGPYTEGWAVFATEFMIEAGYHNTPEMQLTWGKQALRVIANTILDVKMQTMNMTDKEALDFMIQQTFQEREEAEKKVQRAQLSSCQLPTYFVGWRSWDRLRDDYRSKKGDRFKLSDFNERSLRQGAIPIPALKEILLQ